MSSALVGTFGVDEDLIFETLLGNYLLKFPPQ
jgi:hypothetical protein